ncbi:hypothetical protein OG21DRAFT_1526358 [Imleria badia]|nr:hypothetical protein OG21DRAFT_1526358 [Imleria badia]
MPEKPLGKARDIFDVQFQKAPTIRVMEVELLTSQPSSEESYGHVTTWLARGLKIEEAQMSLARDMRKLGVRATDLQRLALARRADQLSTEIVGFLAEALAYLRDDGFYFDFLHCMWRRNCLLMSWMEMTIPEMTRMQIALEPGWERLQTLELRLWMGQANDALHEIRLVLANKAILFWTDVQHVVSHARSTQAWSKVHVVDAMLGKHAAVYRCCRKAMLKLGADQATLSRYQGLREEDLKVTSTATAANARGNRNQGIAWFWSMDVPRDMERDDWMSEYSWKTGHRGVAGYAARQEAIYRRLGDQCWVAREGLMADRADGPKDALTSR